MAERLELTKVDKWAVRLAEKKAVGKGEKLVGQKAESMVACWVDKWAVH